MKYFKISFNGLDTYHENVPMIKEGDQLVEFVDNSNYILHDTEPFYIDMAKEESTALWKDILVEENTEIIIVLEENKMIGGCITVTHSPEVRMLKGDMTNAVLWDIRVDPKYQHLGIGTQLLNLSLNYARGKNCDCLLIETQNNNPKAISFYLKNGASLLETNKDAYPELPNETQYILKIET